MTLRTRLTLRHVESIAVVPIDHAGGLGCMRTLRIQHTDGAVSEIDLWADRAGQLQIHEPIEDDGDMDTPYIDCQPVTLPDLGGEAGGA